MGLNLMFILWGTAQQELFYKIKKDAWNKFNKNIMKCLL